MDIQELDKTGLRKFGLTTGAIVIVLFALFFPWIFGIEKIPIWPWVVACPLWGAALIAPVSLRSVYTTWMKIGYALGWMNTRIILGVLFYLLILPMGLLMRLFGNDPMNRKKDVSASSYRIKSESEPRSRLERPY